MTTSIKYSSIFEVVAANEEEALSLKAQAEIHHLEEHISVHQISPNARVDIVRLAIRQPLLLSCLLADY
jgi:hypothetical protein